MNDRSKFGLSAMTLLVTSQVPSVAVAQASGPASGASQPPRDSGVRVIDPTFFIAIGVALIIGFIAGRLSAGKRAAMQ